MFDPAPDSFVDLKNWNVLHLFHSLNQPGLSPEPGLPAEPAQAFFIVCEGKSLQLRLFVGLCFLNSSHRILYASEDFAAEETPERLSQAESFVGEMGFMMDDLHFGGSSDQEQKDILRTTPFFYRDQETFLEALSGSEKELKGLTQVPSARGATGGQKYSFFLEHYVRMLSML